MTAHAYFYRSVPDASFIVEDESVWLRLEGRMGCYALLDLGPLARNGTINIQVLGDWSRRIIEVARTLTESDHPVPGERPPHA